ncbi:hypothetical protein PENSTE_c035G06818 [Penicillium steckii]|uniref:Arginase n=1 Tax=Penicillium steckii TaxID=303698 RepID=A0A1V6SL34_9EURO|nr:hypothetical protein PENSTE_c035G06818 [Penicillium steckii]
MAASITIIFSPYHVGLRDHRVGNGPHRILSLGLTKELKNMGILIKTTEIEPVDDFEGEIGRSFEIMRRISKAVTTAVSNNSFPLILSDLAFVYFDAHDDLDSPNVNENGYFDAMGLSMLRGESWKTLMSTVPGYQPHSYERFLYCGLRDQSDVQKQRVLDAGMHAVWGSNEHKVDYVKELGSQLGKNSYSPALVHLDLDVLDESYGKVNDYPSPGGMFEDELVACMELVPKAAAPKSLTVCSFDPNAGDGDRIAKIAIRAVASFCKSLIDASLLEASY